MERLTLNDSSVAISRENSAALGAGFRCGYADTFEQRLFLLVCMRPRQKASHTDLRGFSCMSRSFRKDVS